MLSGGGPLFRQRDRGHVCASTIVVIMVIRWQTQQSRMTTMTGVLGGPVGDEPQSSKSVEVGGDDMHDRRGGLQRRWWLLTTIRWWGQGRIATLYSFSLILWASAGENQKETIPANDRLLEPTSTDEERCPKLEARAPIKLVDGHLLC
jgi:hypothetical protein